MVREIERKKERKKERKMLINRGRESNRQAEINRQGNREKERGILHQLGIN